MKPSELPINTVIDTEDYGMFIKLKSHAADQPPVWNEMFSHCSDCAEFVSDGGGKKDDPFDPTTTKKASSDEFFKEFTVVSMPIVVHEIRESKKNPMQIKVETFMEACDQEVKKYPELTTVQIRDLRIRLMASELLGSKLDLRVEIGGQVLDFLKDKSDELVVSMLKGDLVGIADGIGDLLYVVIGTAAAYGINIQEVFDEIHRSNMSKTLWNEDTETYTVIKDEGGKVLKPEGYSPADIASIINRQIEAGKSA